MVAVAHSSGRMAVEIDTMQVEEHSVLEVLDTVDNLKELIWKKFLWQNVKKNYLPILYGGYGAYPPGGWSFGG